MTDLIKVSRNQAQVDSRANLFYFLQSLPEAAEDKSHCLGVDSPVPEGLIQTYQRQNGFVL